MQFKAIYTTDNGYVYGVTAQGSKRILWRHMSNSEWLKLDVVKYDDYHGDDDEIIDRIQKETNAERVNTIYA